ncbi:MAG TPA: tetrameric acyl-CoA thioesterase [Xanthomonadaceae bacterium]|jgi:acyl-coenzyme A thioesterase PaaI-like protein|nr:tetrameric acyl-CoA thioesterase [Xanthomonadaceae bacterium]
MSPRLLRHLFNLWPPFLLAGIHVTRLGADWRSAEVELRMWPWNRNYVGTHFGGSLFAMTDPWWMILAMHALGPDYVVWDKAGEIEFVKPGRGTVRCRFQLTDAALDELRTAAADGAKVLRWFDGPVVDAEGDVVARVRKQLYVRLKPRARPERDGVHTVTADAPPQG